jgi:preprotein translocase subunit SecA
VQLIANRFGSDFTAPSKATEVGAWESFESLVMDAVQESYRLQAERFFGNQGQIASDLEIALKQYKQEPISDNQWSQLLRTIGQGQRVSFDAKTHRKVNKAYTRINFVYYVGKLLQDLSREELRAKIWDHFQQTLAGLREIFGEIDWARLRSFNVPLGQLKPETQEGMSELIGADQFEANKNLPPAEIDAVIVDQLKPFLGWRIQNEVFRSVILRSITSQWVDYLTQIEGLRVSISMESYAQRNPLVVYKTRAAEMFSQLLNDIRRSVVERIFITQPQISMLTAAERMSLTELRQLEDSIRSEEPVPEQEVTELNEQEEESSSEPAEQQQRKGKSEKQVPADADAATGKSRRKKKKMKR